MNPPRVLIAEQSLPNRRLLREALSSFLGVQVDDTPSAETAFEMALQRPYALMILALDLPLIQGDLLDRLIATAYPHAHPGSHTAPPVIYLLRSHETQRIYDLRRNARVRGHLSIPLKLDALMQLTQPIIGST
jgi:CheY-like chemotaxis protein